MPFWLQVNEINEINENMSLKMGVIFGVPVYMGKISLIYFMKYDAKC